MEILIVGVVSFIAGILVDHLLLNKVAGLVSAEVAKLQADVAHLTGQATAAINSAVAPVVHVNVPAAAPTTATPPVLPA